MNIKNQSSTVPVSRSVEKIISLLVSAKATNISMDYESGDLIGITFTIFQNGTPVLFKLPAEVEAVEKYFTQKVKRKNTITIKSAKEQAARTAWKMLEEWIALQISYVEIKKVDLTALLLAQIYSPKTGKTFYETMKENGFKLLTQEEGRNGN